MTNKFVDTLKTSRDKIDHDDTNQPINSSNTKLPPEASPKGVATADGSLLLPIHALPLAHSNPFFLTPLSLTYSFTHLPSGLTLL